MEDDSIKDVIKKAIELHARSEPIIEFVYPMQKRRYSIDLFVQIGGDLFIFECKKGIKENKAVKQSQFHKSALLLQREYLLWNRGIHFGDIYLFYVSEKTNTITNISTGDFIAFDPVFLQDPVSFLLGGKKS